MTNTAISIVEQAALGIEAMFPGARYLPRGIKPIALCNLIYQDAPQSWGGAYHRTLTNIRDCIAAGDLWFEEECDRGFRVFTDSGFSAIVPNRLYLPFGTA
jgi:hypothetical protein